MVKNRHMFLLCVVIGSKFRVLLLRYFIGSTPITCNTEVTRNGLRANAKFHISLVATLMQAIAFLSQARLLVQTDCDYRHAFKVSFAYTDPSRVNTTRRVVNRHIR